LFTYSFIHLFVCLFIRLFIYLFIYFAIDFDEEVRDSAQENLIAAFVFAILTLKIWPKKVIVQVPSSTASSGILLASSSWSLRLGNQVRAEKWAGKEPSWVERLGASLSGAESTKFFVPSHHLPPGGEGGWPKAARPFQVLGNDPRESKWMFPISKQRTESSLYHRMISPRKNMAESPSFAGGENPPVLFSSDFRIPGVPEKSESERRLGAERRLLGLRAEPPELDLSYSHVDLGKRPTKDSYTLTEELAELS
uniref:Uncharacterized protein n=1 Tax=Sarcophilus harrisii TaxID=9305 RepID=A0A7N4PAQ1_SARHA